MPLYCILINDIWSSSLASLLSEKRHPKFTPLWNLFLRVELHSPLSNWFSPVAPLAEPLSPVLAIGSNFSTTVTRVKVTVHKVKVIAILDTGSHVNVISSRFFRKIKMAPDSDHSVFYGTAGLAGTQSVGVYSAPASALESWCLRPMRGIEEW